MLQQHGEEILANYANIEELENILSKYENVLFRIKEAEIFIGLLSNAVPKICQLLLSKNIAEVLEAINFFTFAFKLDLSNAVIGIQKMLRLIFTKEKSIKEKLLGSFVEIYLNEYNETQQSNNQENDLEGENDEDNIPNVELSKSTAFKEIRNFSNMILQLNQGELICAEALVQELYKINRFTLLHQQVLWERYAMKLSKTSEEDARAALIIIGMLVSAKPELIQNSNALDNLISISLIDRCNDLRLVADTCDVLIRSYKLPTTENCDLFYKLPDQHLLFSRLQIILEDSISALENPYWNRMAAGIVKVIYYYSEKPDFIISRIVENVYKKMNLNHVKSMNLDTRNHLDSITSSNVLSEVSNSQTSTLVINDIIVSRFLSLLGDVAITCLIHLDYHLMREIKIRHFIREQQNQKKKDAKAKEKRHKDKRKSKRILDDNDDDDEEDPEGPEQSLEEKHEIIQKTCSEYILYGLLIFFLILILTHFFLFLRITFHFREIHWFH